MDAGGREFRFHRDLYSQESTFPLVLTMEMNEHGYKIKGPHWNALRSYSNGDL